MNTTQLASETARAGVASAAPESLVLLKHKLFHLDNHLPLVFSLVEEGILRRPLFVAPDRATYDTIVDNVVLHDGIAAAREPARDRAAGSFQPPGGRTGATTGGAAGAWQPSASQTDVLRQLDRDARARSQGSERAQDFRSQRSAGGQSRSRSTGRRSRGGRGRG